ncbi:MAG: energy-coupling factor transporter transmembrane component T [Dermatophilaceae bacterium]
MRTPTHRSGHRVLHPVAWWVWGLGLATAAAHTTNPVLLALVVGVTVWVVLQRQEVGTPGVLAPFLLVGALAIGLRVVLTVVLGNGIDGEVVLVRLPQLHLPAWAAGVRLGGPVTLEGVAAAAVEGARLGATLACFGAANALASPRRLLRHAPATLYDVGTAVVVALTYAPQMAEHAGRVRAARRLRGHDGRGLRELARLAVPVLEGSLERSLHLAASMESRGYGRTPVRGPRARTVGSVLALLGGAGILGGLYGVLGPAAGGWLGLPMLAAGSLVAALALVLGSRGDARTAYRRDPWARPEWLVCGLGVLAAGVLVVADARGWDGVHLAQVPLQAPGLPPAPLLAIAAAALAGALTPVPPGVARARATARTERATPAEAVAT